MNHRPSSTVSVPSVLLGLLLVTPACSETTFGPHLDGSVPLPGEACDGFDDNGDGQVDEGCTCKRGVMADCYPGPQSQANVGICRMGSHVCQGTEEWSTWGPCDGAVLPQFEICGNGIDEDCDGSDLPCDGGTGLGTDLGTDLGAVGAPSDGGTGGCSLGQTQACYDGPAGTAGVGACKQGTQTCAANGTWGLCTGQVVPGSEVCDNKIDEDCDGKDKLCCFEKDFGKLIFDCNCNKKKLTCPAGYHRTDQRYTGTQDECSWDKHKTWAELECCKPSCTGTHDADHTYITCCPN